MPNSNNAARLISVILSLDGCYNLDDEHEIQLIKDDIKSEISCCWHDFAIKDIRIVGHANCKQSAVEDEPK